MDKPDKFHVFTLYFQETPADGKWIDAFEQILWLADQSCKVEWRRKYDQNVSKVFLNIHKSGIVIDTIEQPRVAVFIRDTVEMERPGRNGTIERHTVKSWGFGGKTAAQLRRKLVALLVQVLDVLEWMHDPDRDDEIDRADAMGLLGFTAPQEPEENR